MALYRATGSYVCSWRLGRSQDGASEPCSVLLAPRGCRRVLAMALYRATGSYVCSWRLGRSCDGASEPSHGSQTSEPAIQKFRQAARHT
eukprot:scaffold43165_cov129-Isochrysis_galbana.AAC.2